MYNSQSCMNNPKSKMHDKNHSPKKRKAPLNGTFRLERRFSVGHTEKHEKNEIEVMRGKIDVFISKYLYYIIIPLISQWWCKFILK